MTIKHLYPTQRPSLDLNFARTKRLDPRVTFTRGSTATYVGSDGLIKYAVDNEPRFDHDPETGESLGLLVEEARTNEFDYSNPVSWNPFGSWSITANTTTAPDGTTTAATFEKTSTSRAILYRSTAGTANRTRSFFAKAGTTSWVFIEQPWVWFNLSNGTIGTDNSGGTASIEALPNGWYRCSVYQSNWSKANIEIGISSVDNSTNGSIGDNAHFWGGQQEQGSFATSYIPTSGSTVTRAADVASITGTNFSSWYNQGEGSLFAQYICNGGTVGAFAVWNGAGNDLNYWSIGVHSQAGGKMSFRTRSNQGTAAGSYFRGRIDRDNNLGEVIKIAAAINTDDFAAFTSSSSGDTNLNTGSSVPAPGGYLPPSVDRFVLTHDLAASIHISRLTYYPVRLPDTILQNLTL